MRRFFQFFKILIFQVVRGLKDKKQSKMTKNSVCHALYLRDHTPNDCHLWHIWVKWCLQQIVSFFKILILGFFRVVKGQKLLTHFNSFFNNYLFFKFINKCQKEILRCASPFSHVWFFYFVLGRTIFDAFASIGCTIFRISHNM